MTVGDPVKNEKEEKKRILRTNNINRLVPIIIISPQYSFFFPPLPRTTYVRHPLTY